MILRAMEHSLSWPQLQLLLDDLVSGLEAFDCDRVLNVLAAAVAEYSIGAETRDYVWSRRNATPKSDERKVSDIAAKRRVL